MCRTRKSRTAHIRTRRSRESGGFTLIEMIAVIIVVGIIAAVTAPSIAHFADTRRTAAARLLYRDLLYAQQHAVATGARTWVRFDATADTWSVLAEQRDPPGLANAVILSDPTTASPMIITLGSGDWRDAAIVDATFDGDSLVGFDWLGKPLNASETDLAADGSIQLAGGAVLTVRAVTGHISLSIP